MRNITNGINAILKINRLAEMQACFFLKNLKNSQILLTIFQMAQYVYCMGIKERFTKSQLAVRKDMMCKKNSGVKRGEK